MEIPGTDEWSVHIADTDIPGLVPCLACVLQTLAMREPNNAPVVLMRFSSSKRVSEQYEVVAEKIRRPRH